MNPPAALVDLFAARIDRVLEHLSAELRPGDVLVYRAPHWNNPPAELAPPIPADKLLTAERGRMPVPLTVAEALATVDAARDALAAMFAAELGNAAAALLPAEYQAGALEDPAVIAAWPVRAPGFPDRARDLVLATLRAELAERVARVDLAERAARDVVDAGPVREDLAALRAELATAMSRARSREAELDLFRAPVSPAGPVEALSHLLERVPNLPGEDAAVLGTLPAVASWARGAPLTDEAGRYLGTFPSAGLDALYRHLLARSPLFAAVEAGRTVRELTAAGDPGPAYLAAIRDALGSYARSVEDPDALAAAALEDTPTARRRLLAFTSDLLDAARRVAALFAVDPVDEDAARETALTAGELALRWDVAFAAELDRLGGARADTVRKNAAARWAAVYGPQVPIPDTPRPAPGSLWALWAADVDGPPLWLRVLARELWVSEWRPAAERERAKPPAVWGTLFGLLDRVHRPGGRIVEGVLVDRNGARVLDVRRDEPLPVALVHLEALGMLVRDGAGMLGSLNAHRFTRWAVPTAHTRALNGEPDARVLRVDGGWTGLADAVGARSKKAPGELRAIVSAFAHLWFPLPDGRAGNLLTYTESAAAGNWRSCVDITLGTALLPHYVNGIPRGTDRDLVPLPPLPPFVGRANEHGAQAAMQLGTMAHLRARAAELVRHGGVLVTPDQWAELAKTHGLPADMLAAVLDRWTHDGDDGPAFLEALGGGRYRIAPAHAAVQAFLLEAGRMEVNGAALAKQSSASKRKRLRLDR